jgi:hypothetical protein
LPVSFAWYTYRGSHHRLVPFETKDSMLSATDNPPLTFPLDADLVSIATPEAPWHAAYCKPRQEKALAWDLMRLEIPYFLPMVERETFSGGRRRRGLYPMFKSYLFFSGDFDTRLRALRTNRIVRLVDPTEHQAREFAEQLAAICLALRTAPDKVELHPRLIKGAKAAINSGPMKGIEGVVINDRNKKKLWIEVSILGVGATIELHADLLEVS